MDELKLSITDPRIAFSWRYISPSTVKSQDYRLAFYLRSSKNEKSLSFDVNSSNFLTKTERHNEIFQIYNEKNFKPNKNGRFILVNLIQAQEEANIAEQYLYAEIDGKTHCSLYFRNGCYEDEMLRLDMINILVNNIYDEIETFPNDSNNLIRCVSYDLASSQ